MTPPPSGPASAAGTQLSGRDTAGAGSGVLGARPAAGQTLHGQIPELVAASRFGVGYLLYGLLDFIVDSHFDAVQSLDDCVEQIEDRLFDDIPHNMEVQRRSFQLRKSLVLLRRVVIPMREVVNAVMRRDLHVVGDDLVPYYQDVYDHVLRAAEWNDSLRDLVTSILETNVTIQGSRLNIITKKVTGWAAIIG